MELKFLNTLSLRNCNEMQHHQSDDELLTHQSCFPLVRLSLLECLKSSIKILCIYFYFIATLIGEGVRRRNLSQTFRFPSFNNYGSPLSYQDCFNLFAPTPTLYLDLSKIGWLVVKSL